MSDMKTLAANLDGDLQTDAIHRTIYATDASVYRELPSAVAYPKNESDLLKLIEYATDHSTSLIPRSGGTSLAGQCVGDGIVVDVSRYMNNILDLDPEGKWVKVQPGVILDQLNDFLRPHELMFGPNTSTSNRCTIGGMVGNNSSGSSSIRYKTTREHCLHIRAILSNQEIVDFYGITDSQFQLKSNGNLLENKIYRQIDTLLKPAAIQEEIKNQYPDPRIHRRNNGYALDRLIDMAPFNTSGDYFNLSEFLCGSEGTLSLFSEITLNLVDLPPVHSDLVLPHFNSIDGALRAIPIVMKYEPYACELMDKIILDCTKENKKYNSYRDFIIADPKAILMIEIKSDDKTQLSILTHALITELKRSGLCDEIPTLSGKQANQAWELRKAGLGLLANLPHEAKAVACIEDTAVHINDLPAYIKDFEHIMERFNQQCVYYAHAGAGELHLRPVLNLKLENDRRDFRLITEATTHLVKKYNGALSGEHGDGRVRSEFIPIILGEKIVDLLTSIKNTWDPNNIFNPGKIIRPKRMDENLRYTNNQLTKTFDTAFDFGSTGGMLQMAEKCNGSGDCRKLPESGGSMCPSYMATRNEIDTTRARANALRDYLTNSKNPFQDKNLGNILDLCLNCKGCATECPSNVDMAKLKSEFLYQKNKTGQINKSDKLIATLDQKFHLAHSFGALSYFIANSKWVEKKSRQDLNIHPKRSLPKIQRVSWYKWWKKTGIKNNPKTIKSEIILFCDEFTNYFDPKIGIAATQLLQGLGYTVIIPKVKTSARAAITKGFLDLAKKEVHKLVENFSKIAYYNKPIIGVEPSTILGFKDEYPALLRGVMKEKANQIKSQIFLFEEFFMREFATGRISPDQFDSQTRSLKVHTHCHQKSLSDESLVYQTLSIPKGHIVQSIPSGCCGMAGSFGYDKEHYDLSQKIGQLTLFPALHNSAATDIVVATGHSCRHQIKDGVQKESFHTAEILYEALL